MRKIIIALPKGKRLLGPAYEVFKKAGYISAELEAEIEHTKLKQLEFATDNGKAIFVLVRIADIPQYVDKNWADIGIAAFDCYREYELENATAKSSLRGDNFTSDILPDLKLCAQSRFCVAGRPDGLAFYERCKSNDEKIMTVATQHPSIAAKFFARKGMVVDVITISGSSEVMPKFGGVDCIFDIVESGKALEENGLIIYEEAMPIATKILVSKAAMKYDENMEVLTNEIKQAIG